MSEPRSSPGPTAQPRRTFLFLQGLASPFFVDLARELIARGHGVKRVNLSLGDHLFWPLPKIPYRGPLSGWRGFLSEFLAEHAVTDIVLFGDCRPYHRVAIGLSAHRRVQVHVFEEGYFRPHWITLERGGVNGNSSLPQDPAAVLALGRDLPPPSTQKVRTKFVRRAAWDVGYNLVTMLGRPIFPRFRRHRPNHVLVEYAGWLRRIAKRRRLNLHAAGEVERVCASPNGFFFVPLQLDTDYQIRVHSRFADNAEFLDEVMASFAAHAPAGVELLVKLHPLDNGLVDRRAQVEEIARRHALSDRVTFIDGGWLPALLTGARGVVVVNSTVGTTSLEVGRPTITLGRAIYNIPGLTFQDGLDRFWTEGTPPQAELFGAFRKLVMHRTQVNGGFFDPDSIRLAVRGAADRVEAVPPLLLFFDEPAREHVGPTELYPGAQPAE